jgi:hypothetical protein
MIKLKVDNTKREIPMYSAILLGKLSLLNFIF